MSLEEAEENQEMEKGKKEMKRELSNNSIDDPSPRCVLEIPISGTDSDDQTGSFSSFSSNGSSSSPPQTEKYEHQTNNNNNHNKQWKNMFDAIKKKSMRRFSVIPLLSTYDIITKRKLKRKIQRIDQNNSSDNNNNIVIDFQGLQITKPSWRNFDFSELEAATDNFSSENLIGKGGHAQVYKGCLSDGQIVAVKKIIKTEKEEGDRIGDFLSELGIIAHINHPNAAKLLGFSIDRGLHLVLEYLPQGSLASVLHGGAESLEWMKRFKVALGIAEGLRYLHHDCHRRIIHRDIKASNILLTEDYEAQISDFGLAKWLPENWLHHVVFPIEGTFGYLAPEYFMHGIVDEKTDVFAFGVLLLEIITGRHAVDSNRQSLAMWAKPLLEENNVKDVIDPKLGNSYDPIEMKRAMLTASMCIHHLPSMRPNMNQVVQLLKGDEEAPTEMHQKSMSRRAVILDSCDLQDYTCTNYLNDLNRHMQLVME